MSKKVSEEVSKKKYALPDIQNMEVPQLQQLFYIVADEFTKLLTDCKDIENLKELQSYMRSIAAEIKRRQE
jgi:hypothetical protein